MTTKNNRTEASKPAAPKRTTPKTAQARSAARGMTARSASRAKAAPANGGTDKTWNLRLYVAGDSPKSRTAIDNLTRLCELHLGHDYAIEIIDLRKDPQRARTDQILAIPTLIRKIPEPMKRVIGDLSNADRALVALDLRTPSRES